MVITDGVSTYEHESTIPEALLARAAGASLFVIGIGETDEQELQGIASDNHHVYRVGDFSPLLGLTETLVGVVCVSTVTSLPDPTIVTGDLSSRTGMVCGSLLINLKFYIIWSDHSI